MPVGPDDVIGVDVRQGRTGPVPVRHAVVLIDHQGRNGAALENLVQALMGLATGVFRAFALGHVPHERVEYLGARQFDAAQCHLRVEATAIESSVPPLKTADLIQPDRLEDGGGPLARHRAVGLPLGAEVNRPPAKNVLRGAPKHVEGSWVAFHIQPISNQKNAVSGRGKEHFVELLPFAKDPSHAGDLSPGRPCQSSQYPQHAHTYAARPLQPRRVPAGHVGQQVQPPDPALVGQTRNQPRCDGIAPPMKDRRRRIQATRQRSRSWLVGTKRLGELLRGSELAILRSGRPEQPRRFRCSEYDSRRRDQGRRSAKLPQECIHRLQRHFHHHGADRGRFGRRPPAIHRRSVVQTPLGGRDAQRGVNHVATFHRLHEIGAETVRVAGQCLGVIGPETRTGDHAAPAVHGVQDRAAERLAHPLQFREQAGFVFHGAPGHHVLHAGVSQTKGPGCSQNPRVQEHIRQAVDRFLSRLIEPGMMLHGQDRT